MREAWSLCEKDGETVELEDFADFVDFAEQDSDVSICDVHLLLGDFHDLKYLKLLC